MCEQEHYCVLKFTNSCPILCLALMHVLYLHLSLGISAQIPNAGGALLTNVGLKKNKKTKVLL